MTDADTTDEAADERTTIRAGRDFEQAYRLSASEAGESLIQVGEQLRDEADFTIVTDERELPFAFGEPVEPELEFEGVDDPELELEVTIPEQTDQDAPTVE